MRYENLTVTENYTMIAKNLKKHFTDEPLAYMILEFLYDEALKFNSFGLLTEDMSFYCPVSKIIEMFDGNVSSKTVLEKIKIIEKRNFIKKTPAKILKRPNYYRINFEKIKEIAKDRKITVCNEIPQELTEETPVVAKNATVENQDGYNLKPADNKEKPSDLAIVENKESYKDKIQKAWNRVAEKHGLAKIMLVSDVRLRKFKTALKFFNCDEKTFFQNIHQSLLESNFLKGIGKDWKADFDFFITTSRAIKAFEGAYKDNENKFMQKLQNPDTMSFKEAERLRRDAQLQELKARCQRQEEEEKQKLIS